MGDYFPIGLLLEAHCYLFLKDEVAQRNGNILGNFLAYAIILLRFRLITDIQSRGILFSTLIKSISTHKACAFPSFNYTTT